MVRCRGGRGGCRVGEYCGNGGRGGWERVFIDGHGMQRRCVGVRGHGFGSLGGGRESSPPDLVRVRIVTR